MQKGIGFATNAFFVITYLQPTAYIEILQHIKCTREKYPPKQREFSRFTGEFTGLHLAHHKVLHYHHGNRCSYKYPTLVF